MSKKNKYIRKVIIENIHTGVMPTVEIYCNSMTKEAAEKETIKIYGNSWKLKTIII